MLILLIEFNYKDLLTSVKIHVRRSVIVKNDLRFSDGSAEYNIIRDVSEKGRISLPVIPGSLAEYLQILKKDLLHLQ